MYFYISSWKFEPSGKPVLDDSIETTIPGMSPDRQLTVHVPNRSVHLARRTLGPIKCPGRNQSAQYDSVLKMSDELARTIQSSALSKREAWTAYFVLSTENVLRSQYLILDQSPAQDDPEEADHGVIPEMRVQLEHGHGRQVWPSSHWRNRIPRPVH
jgi:hypothetical protein